MGEKKNQVLSGKQKSCNSKEQVVANNAFQLLLNLFILSCSNATNLANSNHYEHKPSGFDLMAT
uniref:Uncharacterized protein n=1 Tax=Rhizophora mucronata TaxID=61149 RepID=A0A2P2NQ70_RHIMU